MNTGTSIQVASWTTLPAVDYTPSGEPVMTGATSITSGVLPASITPSAIVYTAIGIPVIRLDN